MSKFALVFSRRDGVVHLVGSVTLPSTVDAPCGAWTSDVDTLYQAALTVHGTTPSVPLSAVTVKFFDESGSHTETMCAGCAKHVVCS